MATIRVPILGVGALPIPGGQVGDVFFQPYSVLPGAGTTWNRMICRFGLSNSAQPTVDMGLAGSFIVPKNYVGSPRIVYSWTATVTTGDVCWQFYCNAFRGDDVNSMAIGAWMEGVTLVDTAPGAAHRRLEISAPMTAANFQPDDDVIFLIYRLGSHALDTMPGSAILFDALFEYSDV
jgi:hypothetical protein